MGKEFNFNKYNQQVSVTISCVLCVNLSVFRNYIKLLAYFWKLSSNSFAQVFLHDGFMLPDADERAGRAVVKKV